MKLRCGFVSNSSSSSYIVYGYGDYSEAVYEIVADKIMSKNPELDDGDLIDEVQYYLEDLGINYFNYNFDLDTVNIGCELPAGDKTSFMSHIAPAEAAFKKFDRRFKTDFFKKVTIYSEPVEE